MPHRIVIAEQIWNQLTTYLLQDDEEHLAFLLTGCSKTPSGCTLLARRLVLIDDGDLDVGHRFGLSLKLEALIAVMNQANAEGLGMVEIHSHPFSKRAVTFSQVDLDGQSDFVGYVQDVLADRPYGALVLGPGGVDGLLWPPGTLRAEVLGEVRVVGANLSRLSTSSSQRQVRRGTEQKVNAQFNRQVLAFGEDGQRKVGSSRVAVVGLGGVGSAIAQQLGHLGVSSFVLVDPDSVETSNLNRLIGASPADVGKPKVDSAARLIHRINASADVSALQSDVRELAAIQALTDVDTIFGCVDTDAGRLVMTELAIAFLVPLIDSGVGITAIDGKVTEAGGRVTVWTPGRPCLKCSKDFSPRIAAEELESAGERSFRVQHGYVAGAQITEPAVVSLNNTIASLAVTEFLALVTNIRPSCHYTYYDLLEQRSGQRIVRQEDSCFLCSVEGIGELARLDRYARVGLPTDLPKVERGKSAP